MLIESIFLGTIFFFLLTLLVLVFILIENKIENKIKNNQGITILKFIRYTINLASILVPLTILIIPELNNLLWDLSLYSVFILMCIRPLRDLFPKLKFARLMPLRKNLGIFSAMIVVSFGAVHYFNLGPSFFAEYFSFAYWSFQNSLFWAHLGELTGFILLITSNKFSMKILKINWKRIQRLSYVYFFSGAWYVFASFDKTFGFIAIVIVSVLTFIAYIKNKDKRNETIIESNVQSNKKRIKLFEDKWDNIFLSIFVVMLIFGIAITSLIVLSESYNIQELQETVASYETNQQQIINSYQEEINNIQLENENIVIELTSKVDSYNQGG